MRPNNSSTTVVNFLWLELFQDFSQQPAVAGLQQIRCGSFFLGGERSKTWDDKKRQHLDLPKRKTPLFRMERQLDSKLRCSGTHFLWGKKCQFQKHLLLLEEMGDFDKPRQETKVNKRKPITPKQNYSWWFQPIWKICSSNWIICPSRRENKKYLKPPPGKQISWRITIIPKPESSAFLGDSLAFLPKNLGSNSKYQLLL